MERTLIKDIKNKVGKTVRVCGFVQSVRDQGSIKFLQLRDVTGLMQIVVLKSAEAFVQSDSLSTESVVAIVGDVKEEKQAPEGIEIAASTIEILSKADPELPIPVVVEKGGELVDITKRFDFRWIDLRRNENLKIFKLWSALEQGFRKYVTENSYITVFAPSFMNAPSESGAEVFEVSYFDRKAYLAQSPQFYKQMAMASGFEKVFMVGPVFRAEPSFTTRHMTEFTGWDFEISYIDSYEDVMAEEEKMLIAAFTQAKVAGFDIEVPKSPFPRITMLDAKGKLAQAGIKSEKEHDLSPEEEVKLGELIKKEYDHDFVFVTDWHKSVRAFYHMRFTDRPDIACGFDLLYKGIEITTGAQREHRYDVLVSQAKEKGMDLKQLENYFSFFRYGCPPHGGGGIGPGRLVMRMLDLASVKESAFLPRDVKRLTP